jgi:lysophospholipid acyltransferase (LPLAT)-like uncharacterized protein
MLNIKLIPFLVSLPAWALIQLIGRTNPIKCVNNNLPETICAKNNPFIFSVWHSRLMLPIYPFRNKNLAALVSRSKDGEYITQLMNRFNFQTARGSASRYGAEGLLGLLHWLKHNGDAVVTPDGPRGPREKVQAGVIQLAKLSGVPIIPTGFSCSRSHRFQSWDRFMLPLPFGNIYLMTGEAIHVPEDADKPVLEECRLRLEKEMHRVTAKVDRLAGQPGIDQDADKALS